MEFFSKNIKALLMAIFCSFSQNTLAQEPDGDLIDSNHFVKLQLAGIATRPTTPMLDDGQSFEDAVAIATEHLQKRLKAEGVGDENMAGDNDVGIFRNSTIWRETDSPVKKNRATGNLEIPVCWLNMDESYVEGREISRVAIETTWGKSGAKIKFIGWGQCNSNKQGGIRIQVDESGPRSFIGSEGNNESATMWLNFKFNSWSADCRENDSRRDWATCIHSIAVHEFGHALGFLHEHNRLFWGDKFHDLNAAELAVQLEKCKSAGETSPTDSAPSDSVSSTDYDSWSVLSYCEDLYSHKVKLSPLDVATVRHMYP